jgi:tyrosyl-tRNA synthetase
MPEIALAAGEDLPTLLVRAGMTASKGEARRLIEGGGVRREADGAWAKIASIEDLTAGANVLKIGKKGRFLRVAR